MPINLLRSLRVIGIGYSLIAVTFDDWTSILSTPMTWPRNSNLAFANGLFHIQKESILGQNLKHLIHMMNMILFGVRKYQYLNSFGMIEISAPESTKKITFVFKSDTNSKFCGKFFRLSTGNFVN